MSINPSTPPQGPLSPSEPPSGPVRPPLATEISALSKNISSLFREAHAGTSEEPAPLVQRVSTSALSTATLSTYLDSLKTPLTSTQQDELKTSTELKQLLETNRFDVTKYSEEEKENIFNNLLYSFSKEPDLAIQEPVIQLVEAVMPNKRGQPDEQIIFMRYACLVLNMPENSERRVALLNGLTENFVSSSVNEQLNAMTQASPLNLTQMRLFEALLKTEQANETHFTSYSNALESLCFSEQEDSVEDEEIKSHLIDNFTSIVTSNKIISPDSKINYLGAMYSVAASASELPHSSKFLPVYTESLTRDPIFPFIKEQSKNIYDLLNQEPSEDRDRLLANMQLLITALPFLPIEITIKGPDGENFEVTLPSGGTVADLRAEVAKVQGKPLYCIGLSIDGAEDKLQDSLSVRDPSIQAAKEVSMLTKPPISQKDALMALYKACGGDTWQNNTKWNTAAPLSEWAGVTVVDGRVTRLKLPNNNLTGTLPPEIGALTALTQLLLNKNQLSGAIPPEIGALTALKTLQLENNQLSGTIPPDIGGLTALKYLSLHQNQLRGAIPQGIGALTALETLQLENNQLSGVIPETIGALTALETLQLENNQLSGVTPETIGALTELQTLYLYSNQLSGPIPPGIGALTVLNDLNLSQNQLSGEIPPGIGDLTDLRYLYLSQNQLRGAIPQKINTLHELRQLDLQDNKLSGFVPLNLQGFMPHLFNGNPGLKLSHIEEQLNAMTQAPTLNLIQMNLFERFLKSDQANEDHFTSYSNALKSLCFREQKDSIQDERNKSQLIDNFASIVTSNTKMSNTAKINCLGAMYSVAASASELPHSSKFLPMYTESLTRDPIFPFIKEQSKNIYDLLNQEPSEDRDRLLANIEILITALPFLPIEITIKDPDGENFKVTLPSGGTVADLRAEVAKVQGKPLYCIGLSIDGAEDKLQDSLSVRDPSIQAAKDLCRPNHQLVREVH